MSSSGLTQTDDDRIEFVGISIWNKTAGVYKMSD